MSVAVYARSGRDNCGNLYTSKRSDHHFPTLRIAAPIGIKRPSLIGSMHPFSAHKPIHSWSTTKIRIAKSELVGYKPVNSKSQDVPAFS